MKKHLITLGLCLIVLTGMSAKTPLLIDKTPKQAMKEWVDSVYNTMSVEQRVGQLIAQAFQLKNAEVSKREIKRIVEKYHIGFIYFSGGTAKNHAELSNYANSLSEVPLFVAIDGEWGLSMRLADTPRFPKNMMLGAIQDDRLLYEYGQEMARQCKEMGIHINFSPTADVNSNPHNPVIGTRSFGEDPTNVSRKAIAYSRGLEDNGVLSVIKHFPGHGDTKEDSHRTLPSVNRSIASIQAVDLVPFKSYIDAGLGGVMVAHLNIPALHTGTLPSSLSKTVATDLLKNEMGFEGLVFTDALVMKGARQDGKANGPAAFKAGADVLLEPYNLDKSYTDLIALYKQGGESRQAIEASCKKVLAYKYALGLNEFRPVETDGLLQRINTREAELTLRKLYAASITLLKNDSSRLPVKQLDKKTCVAIVGGKNAASHKDFLNTCRRYTDITARHLTGAADATDWANRNKDAENVVVAVYDKSTASCATVASLVDSFGAGKVSLVFFTRPYDLYAYRNQIAGCAAVVLGYETHTFAQEYAAQAVFGGSDATGRIPVTVESVAEAGEGIDLRASRLGYGMPEEVGLDYRLVEQIDSISNLAVKEGAFGGCQVLVARHGKVVVDKNFGFINAEKKTRVDGNSIFDLASVSKATGTLSGIMKAIDDKKLALNGKLGGYIPELKGTPKGDLTIRDLLYHETGMPAALNIFKVMTDSTSFSGDLVKARPDSLHSRFAAGAYLHNDAKVRSDITSPRKTAQFDIRIGPDLYIGQVTADSVMRMIYDSQLRDNRNYRYSCLNFCLLRQAEENVTGIRHDRYVYDNIFRRLGAYRTVYRPLDFFPKEIIAPTECDELFRGGVVQGIVHDETASFSGGIQGNAGLFSNANDLAKLCQMWLNDGMYGGERILSQETVGLFLTSKSPATHRGLGFDKPNTERPERSSTCEEANPEVVGHTGFTGTCFWIDPKTDVIYIFLSNRVYPSRNNPAFSRIGARANIFKYVYESLERNAR